MALTVSNRCVEDAQAETGKAGNETSARSRSKNTDKNYGLQLINKVRDTLVKQNKTGFQTLATVFMSRPRRGFSTS